MRHHLRFPRLSRLLCVIACLHVLAPAIAAVADAWRLDGREAYAHIESEGSDGCVPVHAHDCILCEVATSSSGTPEHAPSLASCEPTAVLGADSQRTLPTSRWRSALAARAPPEIG